MNFYLALFLVLVLALNLFLLYCLQICFKKLKFLANKVTNLVEENMQNKSGIENVLTALANRIDENDTAYFNLSQEFTSFKSRQSSTSTYKHALKLLEHGASIEEIMLTCGLSKAEGELLLTKKNS